MGSITKDDLTSCAKKLASEIVGKKLHIPDNITRVSGWLRQAYLGSNNNDGVNYCPELSKFLAGKYHGVGSEFSELAAGDFLQLLDEAESFYPKYRA